MNKPTPGPWKQVPTVGLNSIEIHAVDETGFVTKRICAIYGNPDFWGNARLIEAAPDLLEALEFAFAHYAVLTPETFAQGGDKKAREIMAAAILKAKGETK